MNSPSISDKSEAPFIQVPLSILKRPDVSQTGKLMYGLILSLSRATGYCYASDTYLGEQLGVSSRQAHRTVSELEGMRIVLVTGATSKRHIKPAYDKNGVSCLEIEPPLTTKMALGLTPKMAETYAKNVHIIEKNKKENRKEILPSAFQDKAPDQNAPAAPGWETLTPDEQQPYREQAAQAEQAQAEAVARQYGGRAVIRPKLVEARARRIYEAQCTVR